MVAEIGSADRFWGRTHGETPILRETYDMVVKWANQFLHHTAFGITMVHVDEAYLGCQQFLRQLRQKSSFRFRA